jgi:hypothetical protein
MLDVDSTVSSLDPTRKFQYRDKLLAMVGGEQNDDAAYLARATKHPLVDLSAIGGSKQSGKDDPVVMKSFFLDEEWVVDRKSERQSVFVNERIGRQGKGNEGQSDEGDDGGGERIATVVSLNSILTSWFFVLNDASIGLMSVNLRNRLDGCDLDDSSAGNYVTCIAYTPDDYRTPGRIQHSLRRLRRCGGPDSPPELPDLNWSMACSLSNDWSRMFREELYLHEDVSLTLHLPLWHVEYLASLPSRFSTLHIFTAQPEGIDGTERRLGATVLCRQSVWRTILESGVVDEMIVDF